MTAEWKPITRKEAAALLDAIDRIRTIRERALYQDSQQSGMVHARADQAQDAINDLLITLKVWGNSELAADALEPKREKADA